MESEVQDREQDAIKAVAARLAMAFPDTPAVRVDQSVQEAYRRFDGSRVRIFVPVLVEHAVRDELTGHSPATPWRRRADEASDVGEVQRAS